MTPTDQPESSPDAGASSAPKAVTAEECEALKLAIKQLNCETVVSDTRRDLKAAATLRSLASRLSSAQGEK